MGRLIDADKLEYTCNSDECGMLTGCNHCQYNIITEDEIESAPTIEAIPKDQYETRLKADMVAILEEIDLEMSEQSFGIQTEPWEAVEKLRKEIIQQKINALKAESE